MAVRGALRDLCIVDLIQLPRAGRKTGELRVTGRAGDGRIWYRCGDAVHASFGGQEGMEAIVRMMDLSEGDYVFRAGIAEPKRTIDLKIHRAVMMALKTRDERKCKESAAARPVKPTEALPRVARKSLDVAVSHLLTEFIAETPFAIHAGVVCERGVLLGRASRPDAAQEPMDELMRSIVEGWKTHPREGLKRVLVEDENGLIAAQVLVNGDALVLVAQQSAPMGEVVLALTRLGRLIEGK